MLHIQKILFSALLWFTFCNNSAAYISNTQVQREYEFFEKSHYILQQVQFWEKIFTLYTNNQVIIHDSHHPNLLIDLIDFKRLPKLKGIEKIPKQQRQRIVLQTYLARYKKALHRFASIKKKALKYGEIEKRIYNVYSQNQKTLHQLYRGKIKIRGQKGLAIEFHKASMRAQYYLPFMENVFSKEGLPLLLTRIPFVESMFQTEATSKAGAKGIWQFINSTGREYMHIKKNIDERKNPFKSTIAAAKLLKSNHQILKSWPLAITAYNHGTKGILRAIKKTGETNLDDILRLYKHNTFGFASRNFYAEVLASTIVFKNYIENNKVKKISTPYQARSILLPRRWTIEQLIKNFPLTSRILRKYNPEISDIYYNQHNNRRLPYSFEIIVPVDIADSIKTSIAKFLNEKQKIRG